MKTFSAILYNLVMIGMIAVAGSLFFAPDNPAGSIDGIVYNAVQHEVVSAADHVTEPSIATPFFCIAILLFAYQFVPSRSVTGARAEVVRRIFSNDLQKLLFPDNSFYSGCQVDEIGWENDEVEIPQDEDGKATVVVNPTQLPLPINIEEDKKKTYASNQLVTLPNVVTWNNQLLVSYDKRAAKLWKHQMSLDEQIAERILNAWGPTLGSFIRQTTGGTTRAATAPGATGNRKISVEADFLWAFTLFNKLNIPKENRRVVVPSVILEDILAIKKSWGQGTDSNNEAMAKGAVTKIFTFDVFERSSALVYTEAGTPVKKAVGAATATTDNLAAVFYHTRMVRYCKSPVQVWMDSQPRGEYAGGMAMNCGVRSGGTISRLSEIGVAALVEDNG